MTTLTDERLTKLTDCCEPISHAEVLALVAEVRASRSSSGSGAAVHGEDVAHACAHAHGMGQEDGFRAGVEAAAQIVAGWHIKRGGYLVLAEAIRALSSAPPSPSGERVRALAQKCVEDVRAIGQRYRDDWSDFDGRTLKEELIEATWGLRRALSPQWDGGTER